MLVKKNKTKTDRGVAELLARWAELSPDTCWLDKPDLGLYVLVANYEQRVVSSRNPDEDDLMRVLHAVQCRSRDCGYQLYLGDKDGEATCTLTYERARIAAICKHETIAIAALGALVQLEEKKRQKD